MDNKQTTPLAHIFKSQIPVSTGSTPLDKKQKRDNTQMALNSPSPQKIMLDRQMLINDIRDIVLDVISSELSGQFSRLEKLICDNKKEFQETFKTHKTKLNFLYKEIEEQKTKNKKLETYILSLEKQTKKNNIFLYNVLDQKNESEFDTEQLAIQIFEMINVHIPPIAITEIARVGIYNSSYKRPIKISFHHFKD